MKFGAVPVADAEGGVAVHSIRQGGLVLKKGTLIGKDEIAALKAAGIEAIVVARTEPGDVSEDTAATEIAAAVAGREAAVAPRGNRHLAFGAVAAGWHVLQRLGKAKQKRADLRLVGLGLVVTRDGEIPLVSDAYPGNHPDACGRRGALW